MQEYSEKWSRHNVLLHSLLGVSNLKQGGSPAVHFNFSNKDKKMVSELSWDKQLNNVATVAPCLYNCELVTYTHIFQNYLHRNGNHSECN